MHLSSVLQDRQNDALVSPAPLSVTHREPRINSRKLATLLTRMFHEGRCISRVFAKRISLMGRRLGVFVQGQFVPIHFQGKCAVTV